MRTCFSALFGTLNLRRILILSRRMLVDCGSFSLLCKHARVKLPAELSPVSSRVLGAPALLPPHAPRTGLPICIPTGCHHMKSSNHSEFLEQDAFRRVLEVERELALRHGLGLSLAWPTLESSDGRLTPDKLKQVLVESLFDSIRATDLCGWLEDHGPAVLLRCTGMSEAHVVVERIEQVLAARGVKAKVQVWTVDDDHEAPTAPVDLVHRSAAKPRPRDLNTLLARQPSLVESVINRLVAAVLCVCVAPVALAAAALIKFGSRGPVLFRQRRVGLGGREFMCLKFRTMVVDAESQLAALKASNEADGPVFKMRADPRVTRVGRWLRMTSMDELPQLLNVVKGDMNLVGPRPPIPAEVSDYRRHERMRLDVMPGITGLWQVSGRSNVSFSQWVRLDLRYRRSRSWLTDAKILVRTLPAVLRRDGAW